MMKNTKIFFGLLVLFFMAANSCTKCPQCPTQNIVTDDSDTLSFSIVTDDSDTLSFKMAAPMVTVDGKLQKASIVIDNVDMARVIMNAVDTMKYNVQVRPREQQNTPQRQ